MADTTDWGGLLFGGGGSGLEGYLTPEQQQGLNRQAMLAAGASLLANSGPRRYGEAPVNTGQIIGQALMSGMQGYNQAAQGTMANMIAGQKMLEAKRLADIQKQVAATFAEQPAPAEGAAPLSEADMKFNQYMKLANIYAMGGKGEEAKRYQEMAFQIKPRAEVTGAPFEVSDASGKPLLVQQMKDGTLKTVEGFGPKRDIQLVDLGGRTVAVDKAKLTGSESFTKTLAPQIVGGAETGYYAVGGGGGGGAGAATRTSPAVGGAGGQVPQGTAGGRANAVVPAVDQYTVPAPNLFTPRATNLQPIIAGTGAKPSAEFMKASKQLNDLEGALKDYKTEIKSDTWVVPKNIPLPFSDTGIPLPTGTDTARVAGKYNSLLMGVKNLYELGALTGPDMSIIERQLTNPASWTGLLTSKGAMNEQIKVLEDMLTRAKDNLSTSYRQTVPAASTAGGTKEWVWQNGQLVPKK